ncbi:MAG TPA: aminotransferase class I/II-fold pyridoxal phosphate-dependent enzyme [Albidovulum sp.]|uniref:aminotransferase class I/II-fold pyridoxal phosphate-dependent enzyme n=1 Tax=Albidovulum sp. TaxID=1872424 RepID=UPI002BC4B954|nr:aminotransferase class I/II-fold pyridoxal phosphate-dependent enzyme [Albidovulum sp.]
MYDVTRTIDVLDGVTSDYHDAGNPNLLDRWQPMRDWLTLRLSAGVDPSCKALASRVGPRVRGFDRAGNRFSGINFASQDSLGLSSHPHVIAAATDAALQYGVHSAGPAAQMGLTGLMLELEARVARFLGMFDATVFPAGLLARQAVIRTLVRPGDHILIDCHADAGLRDAAEGAAAKVHRFVHGSTEAVERRLLRLRKNEPRAGILIVTEGIFGLDGDSPDIAALQALAWEFGATLLVDVSRDLGALGPTGRGALELQNMLGKVDVVVGSFSATFASNGGFVATDHPALKPALRLASGAQGLTSALAPMQAAAAIAAFDIVECGEGVYRRERLMANANRLSDGLLTVGFEVLGQPGALVPVRLGSTALARRMTTAVQSAGGIVNLIEEPLVAKNDCRWNLQMTADHTDALIDEFVSIAATARATWTAPGPAVNL